MHAQTFKNQKRYNLDKTPIKPREHKGVTKQMVVQIISKTQINTRLNPKFNE